MYRKQQMLYSANKIMCNTLKIQIICFKNNLDITFTWHDDFISDIIDDGAWNECVSIVSMWKAY